jgi:DHA1 family bicyclomycin/chloramphenicol resistance-like MFS transporter
MPTHSPRKRRILVVLLASLSAIGSISVDLYLPALPTIQESYNTSAATAQYTMVLFLIGAAVGMLSWGPISDRFGRKPPLYVSVSLYMAVSAGCALAPSIDTMIGLRFLQALCSSAGAVIGRAIVRDLFHGIDAARVYATIMATFALAPLIAPIVGSYLLILGGWPSLFWTEVFFAFIILITMHLLLRETHASVHTKPLALGHTLRGYGSLLRDRTFAGYAAGAAFGTGSLFVYIAVSSHIFISVYGLSPQIFGWVFGLNAVGVMIAARVASYLHRRLGVPQVLRGAFALQTATGYCVLLLWLVDGGVWTFALSTYVFLSLIGAIAPSTTALAMESQPHRGGMASALIGTLQFVTGAAGTFLVGLMPDNTPLPLILVIVIFSTVGLMINLLAVSRHLREAR